MKQFSCAVAGAAMMIVASFSTGALAATECSGTKTGAISGGLVVHAGDTCFVDGANVSGGIHMDGGTLRVCGSTISGGIQADIPPANRSSSWVIIGQNAEQIDTPDETPCAGNTINGGVDLQHVQGAVGCCGEGVQIEISTINGGVELKHNSPCELEDNMINGGCHASDNEDVYNDGFPNLIHGGAKGQCMGL